LSGMTTGKKFSDNASGPKAFNKQQSPQQYWLMSLVAVSPSPGIRLMSVRLYDIRVVEAHLGRACPVKFRTAIHRDPIGVVGCPVFHKYNADMCLVCHYFVTSE
jgi:hypothetical protein